MMTRKEIDLIYNLLVVTLDRWEGGKFDEQHKYIVIKKNGRTYVDLKDVTFYMQRLYDLILTMAKKNKKKAS